MLRLKDFRVERILGLKDLRVKVFYRVGGFWWESVFRVKGF